MIPLAERAMSERTRCLSGSKNVGDGAQYSLAQRQPENARVNVAQ